MEENKIERKKGNNTILVVIIILLVIAVGILIGYILVDKTKQSQPTTQEKAPTAEENKDVKEEENKKILSVENYPKESDNTAIALGDLLTLLTEEELTTNISSITKTQKSSTIEYSCAEPDEDIIETHEQAISNANGCAQINVTVDNIINYKEINPIILPGYMIENYVYKTEKYYIIETRYYGESDLRVYDKTGKEVLNTKITSYFYTDDNNNGHSVPLTFKENIMYYVEVLDRDSYNKAQLEFKNVDLSKSALSANSIEKLSGKLLGK